MLQLKILNLFCGLLAVIAFQAQVQAARPTTTVCPPDDIDDDRDGSDGSDGNNGNDGNNGTDTLCPSFQALRATIEKDTLVDLIQSHYQCDSKFRKAMCYYNTTRFHVVAQQLQQSDAYLAMLEDLRSAGVDTSDIENIVDIFACLELPAPRPDKSCDCKELRGHTFIGDLLAAMPHQAVHAYTADAHANHTNYARFVDTVTSAEFQARLRANMMKRDVARTLRVLRRNGWDVPELLRATMTILSW